MRIAVGIVLLVLGALGMLWVQLIVRSRRNRQELRAMGVDLGNLTPSDDGMLQGALKLMCAGAAGIYVLIYENIGFVEGTAIVVAYIGCCLCIHAIDLNDVATSSASPNDQISVTGSSKLSLLLSGLLLLALGVYFAGGRDLLS